MLENAHMKQNFARNLLIPSAALLVVCIGAWLGMPVALEAQYGGRTMYGVVTDPQGLPIHDAKVTIRLTSSTEIHEKLTDYAGGFQFQGLTPGSYVISVDKPGYKRATKQPVMVLRESLGQHRNATVRITMEESATEARP
jgi:uncharacterized protein (DUF2141 family)